MRLKYSKLGRKPWPPEHRLFGTDLMRRDRWVAYQKHRAQAKYRGESYELSWEEWDHLWEHCWEQRGRGRKNLCLSRIDFGGEWAIHNVVVVSRQRHFDMLSDYNRQQHD